ncbi:hypothetical protein A2482_00260 [Candidatus Falkowbacteria bacterium RIFOXYC2_FULL_48_21]|uniref:Uncharacterized protein n=1 Tax=Candidatus Falkowbacteria bacterium RIFOXYC2_FULL_48_21 TaxID=1798005 RepID=A0A1F5TDP4_9BACT|nr:MAG: hypothetical protein A2482_00260 [Candidatus Falkowbacteria bacterium RIFOXYC2_FULL_48_21]
MDDFFVERKERHLRLHVQTTLFGVSRKEMGELAVEVENAFARRRLRAEWDGSPAKYIIVYYDY